MSKKPITYYIYQYEHPQQVDLGVFVSYTTDVIQIQRSHRSNVKNGRVSPFYDLIRRRGETIDNWVFSVIEECGTLEEAKSQIMTIFENLPKVINKIGRGVENLTTRYYVDNREAILKEKREYYAANRESILKAKKERFAKQKAEKIKAILRLRRKQRRELKKEIAALKNQVDIYILPNDSENNEITSKTEEVSGDI